MMRLSPPGRRDWLLALVLALVLGSPVHSQENPAGDPAVQEDPWAEAVEAARLLFHQGEYEDCLKRLTEAEESLGEERRLTALRARCLAAEGEYANALEVVEDDWSFEGTQEGQMMLYDIRRAQGDMAGAKVHLEAVFNSRRFAQPRDLLAIGRAALIFGSEPKDILDRFYKQVLKQEPKNAEVYGHIGELAQEKYDYQLAAENYDLGLQLEPKNTDLKAALASCFFETDRAHALTLLEENLEVNPRHVDSLLMLAQHHLLAELEDKSLAVALIERAEAVNPRDYRPDTMRAVMALLAADEKKAEALRAAAKEDRPGDPRIDYHIGEWMSSLMRFQEAVPYLRASLETDSEFLPAKIALGQNLLRIGEEAEAWVILEGVSDRDQYNVAVYNLLALHDEIEDYQIMNRKHFIVRMEASEARLYGQRVLDLLEEAEASLHGKYGFTPTKPILVEFFPRQEDFAVRTFGFMGGDGFLGACFGLVVTMNSPNNGATGKTNWESTLWHEYCHAVTLGATRNRMPRWLTEGLSVYEERQRDPRCGEQMEIDFRHMILKEDELIPLTQLNYGFLKPKSGKHMMFAYLQSSLFVEYFMETFGEDAMRNIIRDLREGESFSRACEKHAQPLGRLEDAFFVYAKDRARDYGGKLEWELPEENLAALGLEELQRWTEANPANYYGLRAYASALLNQGRLGDAEAVLRKMVDGFPGHADSGSPYQMLADLYRETGERDKEMEMRWELVSRSTDWLEEMLILLEYETEAERWDKVETLARYIMAINPYIGEAHQAWAKGLAGQGRSLEAVDRYETLLTLKPRNPAQVHYAVADLLKESDPERAKRHTLDALAEAPRYREALRLLRRLQPEGAGES